MRILFLTNFYPPFEIGGYEQWAKEIALALNKKGHEIIIITSRRGKNSNSPLESGAVIRSLYLQSDLNYYRPLDFFLKAPFQEKNNLKELERHILEYQPDVVLVWGMWNFSLNLPYYAEKLMPDRVAYYIASYWPADIDPHRMYWNLPTNHKITKPIKHLLKIFANLKFSIDKYPPLLEFKNVVCCSKYVRDTLVTSGHLPQHAGILYGGIDTNPFSQKNEQINNNSHRALQLLYFGRLVEQKGVINAIEALDILKQRGMIEKVELTIVGKGHSGYEANLRSKVNNLGINDRVHFYDWIPRERVPKFLKKFDVYLFTSIWPEPMARSVMEAMASGLLVIGSEVGGQTEMLINDQNALTFKPNDSRGLSEKIISILDHPTNREKLSRAGLEMVNKRFTLSRMADEIEEFLFQIPLNNQFYF
jgi:glycogen synthase